MARDDQSVANIAIPPRHLLSVEYLLADNSFLSLNIRGKYFITRILLFLTKTEEPEYRAQFAKEHAQWTEQRFINEIWTDVPEFNMFRSGGIAYVRRTEGQNYVPSSVNHESGNINLWCKGDSMDWEWALSCTWKVTWLELGFGRFSKKISSFLGPDVL